MFGLGFGEITLLILLTLVLVGPERMPGLVRTAGRLYGRLREVSDELHRAFLAEADRQDRVKDREPPDAP